MKSKPIKYLEQYRITTGPMCSTPALGNNGAFVLPPIYEAHLRIVAADGEGWDHVSVSLEADALPPPCPSWNEMVYVRTLFFRDDEWPIQYGPGLSANINNHAGCLHWWRPQDQDVPRPPVWMV